MLSTNSNTVLGGTISSSTGSLRDWLSMLKDQANELQLTALMLQKAISVLDVSTTTPSIITKRISQLEKVNQSRKLLNEEINIIETKCTQFGGPDCTRPCDIKCLNCSSPGNCSVCSGNFDGATCSVCKVGWKGVNCTEPVCDSKCTLCSSPGKCSVCSGNFIGSNCSTCKYGFIGIDCNTIDGSLDFVYSVILTSSTYRNRFMSEIMGGVALKSGSSPRLLFRASRDGFASSTFHSRCDNKGANIVIVKSTSGAIFGGYTSKSWTSNSGYVSDPSAFLFSLISSSGEERFTKLTQEKGDGYKRSGTYEFSIYNSDVYSTYGPWFGSGDLRISDSANTVSDSGSDLCNQYCDSTMTSGIFSSARTYMAGSMSFLVADYEVYSF